MSDNDKKVIKNMYFVLKDKKYASLSNGQTFWASLGSFSDGEPDIFIALLESNDFKWLDGIHDILIKRVIG